MVLAMGRHRRKWNVEGIMRATSFGVVAAGFVAVGVLTGCTLSETDPGVEATWVTPTPGTAMKTAVQDAEKALPTGPLTVPEGTWVVGIDMEPGEYMPISVASELCIWTVTSDDEKVKDFGAGAGRPKAKVAEGDTFTSTGCGTWVRQS